MTTLGPRLGPDYEIQSPDDWYWDRHDPPTASDLLSDARQADRERRRELIGPDGLTAEQRLDATECCEHPDLPQENCVSFFDGTHRCRLFGMCERREGDAAVERFKTRFVEWIDDGCPLTFGRQ